MVATKVYSTSPKAPALLEIHHQIVYCPGDLLEKSYPSAEKRCILQPHPTEPLVGGIKPLDREAVGVFYNISQLSYLLGLSYPFAVMQSVFSSPQPAQPIVVEVLPLCKEAVGVFYSLRRLSHTKGEPYLSV